MSTKYPKPRAQFGKRLNWCQTDFTGDNCKRLAELTREAGFVVVKGATLSEQQCESLCYQLGTPVEYEDKSIGYGYKVLLTFDGAKDPDKAVTGAGAMPLHSDGVLFESRVDMALFYCLESASAVEGDGATIICDQVEALRTIPEGMTRTLERVGLEYYAVERGFFTVQPQNWFGVSAFKQYPEGRALYVALPYAVDAPAAWRSRIAGWPEQESNALLAELDTHLRRPPYLYVHQWEAGDLLLVDNRLTLHGRAEIHGHRRLLNGQVNIDGWR